MRIATIIPVLAYEDIEAGHDYLVNVLGFASGGLERTPDHSVVHGEVTLGDQVIWLHRVAPEHGLDAPRNLPASHGGLSVHVPDVDAHHANAKAAGADIMSEPADQSYGLREYGVRDPDGHRFWFFTPLA